MPTFQSAEAGEEMIFNLSNLDYTSRGDVSADGTISSVAEAEATADKLEWHRRFPQTPPRGSKVVDLNEHTVQRGL